MLVYVSVSVRVMWCVGCRSFEDEAHAKLGVIEPVKHGVMRPYAVAWEKDGEFVARFMFTAIIMPTGPLRITGVPFDAANYASDKQIIEPKLKVCLHSIPLPACCNSTRSFVPM